MRNLVAAFLAVTAIMIGGCTVLIGIVEYGFYGFYIWDFTKYIPFLIVAVLLRWLAWRIGKGPAEQNRDQDGDADP